MTAAEAQEALRTIAFDFVRLEERCQEVLDSLPRFEDERAMFEGRIPWDLPTELRTTVECLMEVEIRSAIESLERVSRVDGRGSASGPGARTLTIPIRVTW